MPLSLPAAPPPDQHQPLCARVRRWPSLGRPLTRNPFPHFTTEGAEEG